MRVNKSISCALTEGCEFRDSGVRPQRCRVEITYACAQFEPTTRSYWLFSSPRLICEGEGLANRSICLFRLVEDEVITS